MLVIESDTLAVMGDSPFLGVMNWALFTIPGRMISAMVQVVRGDAAVGSRLVTDPRIGAVSFTGRTPAAVAKNWLNAEGLTR